MRGILYGVGVGPGDPELLTLKAKRLIEEAEVIAIPKTKEKEQMALQIISKVLDIKDKEQYFAYMPMTRDAEELNESHERAATDIAVFLEQGKNVVFLTLGDPTIYSTYSYVHERILAKGFQAEMVPGVTSFCAAAARLNHPLCEGGQPLHIVPVSYKETEDYLDWKGTKVLMKSGKDFSRVREQIKEKGLLSEAKMVSRCGMEQEQVFYDIEKADENASYFSIIVVKEKQ